MSRPLQPIDTSNRQVEVATGLDGTPVAVIRYPRSNTSTFNIISGDDNFKSRASRKAVSPATTPKQLKPSQRQTRHASIDTTNRVMGVGSSEQKELKQSERSNSSVSYNIISPPSTPTPLTGDNSNNKTGGLASPSSGNLVVSQHGLTTTPTSASKVSQRRQFEFKPSDTSRLLFAHTESPNNSAPPTPTSTQTPKDSAVPSGGPLIDERHHPLNTKKTRNKAPGPRGLDFQSSVGYDILKLTPIDTQLQSSTPGLPATHANTPPVNVGTHMFASEHHARHSSTPDLFTSGHTHLNTERHAPGPGALPSPRTPYAPPSTPI